MNLVMEAPKPTSYGFLNQLCFHLGKGIPVEEVKKFYKKAIFKISSIDSPDSFDSFEKHDELELCKKLEKQLCYLNKKDSVPRFNKLYRRLRQSEGYVILKNRIEVISFILRISEERNSKKEKEFKFERPKISSHSKFITPTHKGGGDTLQSRIPSTENTKTPPSSLVIRPTTFGDKLSIKNEGYHTEGSRKRMSPSINSGKSNVHSSYRTSDSLSLMSASPHFLVKGSRTYVPEGALLQELIFCFQGVGGTVLKQDHNHSFFIDPQIRMKHASLVERIMELGYLHNKVSNASRTLSNGGYVAQAIEAGIHKQLINYYGFIGTMQSELKVNTHNYDDTPMREEYSEQNGSLTLRKLFLAASEALQTMQVLSDALNAILNKRGGAILNALDRLRHHGDPNFKSNIQTLFDYGSKPIMSMIKNWMVEGELYDPHNEFFIAVNSSCHDRDIWRDKFILRASMIPNVVSHKLADTILRAGKAVHFLNVICEQKVPVEGTRLKLQNMKDADFLDLTDPRSSLCVTMNKICEETSKLVLDTLVNNFKLFQHFQGLRRYILLGQGDFANYFMELVEPEMRKPASDLRYHELMGLLGSAVRSTTAIHEDPEIMKRVSVKLLVASGGDWGSDVFGLQYTMYDPLDAAFGLSDGAYSPMFNFLWRTKRMEYILFSMRKKRWAIKNKMSSLAEQIPEVNNALVLADRLSQELVHFARQFHYYILFEVVECLWEKFSCALQKATCLDDIISAHSLFIRDIQAQTFQDDASKKFIYELRIIWELVFDLESLENDFLKRIKKEYKERVEREKKVIASGTNFEEEAQFEEKNKKFKSFLTVIRAKYKVILKNYQDVLKKFLLELSRGKDYQLRMLSARLDFNEHYKKNDANSEHMKYSYCGNVFD